MSMTFTKLFSSITESTVWCEPDRIRLVWITMLAMADSRGRVWASVPGLANRARVPVEDAKTAIERFLAPDEYSRTPDHDGRRIEPIDGGWRLLNHEKYRSIRDAEAVKESKRKYINNRRAVERESKCVENVDRGRHNAEADTDTLAKAKVRASRLPPEWEMPDLWITWAQQERPDIDVKLVSANFKDYWIAKPGKDGTKLDWLATWRKWVRSTPAPRNGYAKPVPAPVPVVEVWKPPPPMTAEEMEASKRAKAMALGALKRVAM